ncbi:hypothetical protein ACFL6U_11400 [Planctomycetota bacterium]
MTSLLNIEVLNKHFDGVMVLDNLIHPINIQTERPYCLLSQAVD